MFNLYMVLLNTNNFTPIDLTLTGDTTLGQSGSGDNSNEEVPHTPQISGIRTLTTDAV